MKKSLLLMFSLWFLVLGGCAPFFILGRGGVGEIISSNSMSNEIDVDTERVWNVSCKLINQEGKIIEYKIEEKYLKGVVKQNLVEIKITPLVKHSSKYIVKVTNLKDGSPNLELANKICFQITKYSKSLWTSLRSFF